MTDDLTEAAAKALALSWFGSGIDEVAVAEVKPDAIAVIRVLAPMILDMAADEAAVSRNHVNAVHRILELKERFQ